MPQVKSVAPVNTTNGWAVCQSNDDGSELFVLPDIFEPRYSQEKAEAAAEALKHHLETGGRTYAKPLPPGVQVLH